MSINLDKILSSNYFYLVDNAHVYMAYKTDGRLWSDSVVNFRYVINDRFYDDRFVWIDFEEKLLRSGRAVLLPPNKELIMSLILEGDW